MQGSSYWFHSAKLERKPDWMGIEEGEDIVPILQRRKLFPLPFKINTRHCWLFVGLGHWPLSGQTNLSIWRNFSIPSDISPTVKDKTIKRAIALLLSRDTILTWQYGFMTLVLSVYQSLISLFYSDWLN